MTWSLTNTWSKAALLGAILTSAFLTGCADEETSSGGNGHEFISDRPQSNNYPGGEDAGGDTSSGTGTSGAGGGSSSSGGNAAPDDPEREIVEADIIQVHDNLLYALSQYGGLTIVDISQPEQLEVVGRYPVEGSPFEMYLKDGLVYAMFNNWTQYIYDDAYGYSYVTSSRLEVIDVTNPADPTKVSSFDLPGSVADSRLVGDILYTVTFEDGYCWGCGTQPNTTVTSLTTADPEAVGIVDQLTYGSDDPYGYGWWRRSIHVNQDRIYVGGIEWDGNGYGHSTIQVIDISSPNGILVEGATVEAAGQIESRWQMDELDGYLRVISQPGVWDTSEAPKVQTFTVVSSDDVTPLATLTLDLPMPERLRSVRFDGPKAYAITAVQQDPLFTIDLSNPAQPVQRGMLEMPGWVYHMEPRGDRVYALGFDNGNTEGSLAVSLFDVSDLDNPTMMQRVNFGGDWGSVPEDQDRIHKAFKFVDELGMLLVPYSSWSYDESQGWGCGYTYESGIQLIDFTEDTLVARGLAKVSGYARRAFIANGRLFSVSDADVRSFDVADRDAPVQKDLLPLSVSVEQALKVGSYVVRFTHDWWSGEARLETAPIADAATADPIGSLDLSALAGDQDNCGYSYFGARAFAYGSYVYLVRSGWDTQTYVDVIDVSNPAAPTRTGQLVVPFSTDVYGWWGGFNVTGSRLVQLGTTLVAQRVPYEEITYDDQYYVINENAYLEVFDLSNPNDPQHAKTIKLPNAQGHTPLIVDGSDVVTSHWVPLAFDPDKVKFYADRITMTTPSAPVVHSPVNIPGSILAVDGPTGNLLTMDYDAHSIENVTWETCYQMFGYDVRFEYYDPNNYDYNGPGVCTWYERSLNLVGMNPSYATLLDEDPIAQGTYVGQVYAGDDRVFVEMSHYDYTGNSNDYWNGFAVVGDLGGSSITREDFQYDSTGGYYYYAYPVGVAGQKLVLASYYPNGISVLDASDMSALSYEQVAELSGYTWNVTIADDLALCAMGPYGLQSVDLSN